jgi:hypothetical protein
MKMCRLHCLFTHDLRNAGRDLKRPRPSSAPARACPHWHPTHYLKRMALKEKCTSEPLHQVAARGHLVKWFRGTFLLKRVDRVRLTGRHSHTQANALPGPAARGAHQGYFPHGCARASRQSLSRVHASIAPLYARGKPASYSCFAQGLLLPPTSAGSPSALAARLGRSFRVSGGTRFRTRGPS